MNERRRLIRALGICVLVFLALPAFGESPIKNQNNAYYSAIPKLAFPLDCQLHRTCWVIQYPDTDPKAGEARDFAGLDRTYDGHKGVDIGIRNLAAMREGVTVMAAAAGKVLRTRDGVEDKLIKTAEERRAIQKQACGNAVIIDHGSGFETIYCHMHQGSIRVKPGDRVKAGQPIGLVGLSGLTQFPHMHIGAMLDGVALDPDTGKPLKPEPTKLQIPLPQPLWQEDSGLLAYDPVDIVDIGFADHQLSFEDALDGKTAGDTLSANSPALVLWATIYGVRKDDQLHFEILDPDGKPFAEDHNRIDKTQIRRFRLFGKKLHAPLKPGTYTGRVTLERTGKDGKPIKESREITVRITTS